MKVCDLTQFYSPLSGGVKRYLGEKRRFIEESGSGDEHLLVIPGAKNEIVREGRLCTCTIRSPLISRRTQYRALLDLRAVEEIIARERPDIIESADPYQVGWRALAIGQRQRIPVVAFYHSHFVEAYLRGPVRRLGKTAARLALRAGEAYTRELYRRFAVTLVPSARLAALLENWGVPNTRPMPLGVNTGIFRPEGARAEIPAAAGRTLLLYVGRLASEKNTQTLFAALEKLPANFHLAGHRRRPAARLAPWPNE